MDEIEAFFSPVVWIIGGIVLVIALVFGIGKGLGFSLLDKDSQEYRDQMRSECVGIAKRERERCRKGIFKTTKRIEKCQAIYDEAVVECG